jgi:hypothetical protein
MSMFSTKNGLYERARRQFKIQDGIRLFSYSFYKQRRADVQAFFAQIYSEAQVSSSSPCHCKQTRVLPPGSWQCLEERCQPTRHGTAFCSRVRWLSCAL